MGPQTIGPRGGRYAEAVAGYPYLIVDVFTETALAGDQVAIFTEGHAVPIALLQPLALEMGLSETVFVRVPGSELPVEVYDNGLPTCTSRSRTKLRSPAWTRISERSPNWPAPAASRRGNQPLPDQGAAGPPGCSPRRTAFTRTPRPARRRDRRRATWPDTA